MLSEGSERTEQKRKRKEKTLMARDNTVVIVRERASQGAQWRRT